jgi:hypothetical protein
VNELSGIKESDTGLAPPALWDLAADKQALQSIFDIFAVNLSIKYSFFFQVNNHYKSPVVQK